MSGHIEVEYMGSSYTLLNPFDPFDPFDEMRPWRRPPKEAAPVLWLKSFIHFRLVEKRRFVSNFPCHPLQYGSKHVTSKVTLG
jgi:hypothetical protein